MVVLDILSANGESPNPPVRVRFDEKGGTIGRAPTNTLPLPDPHRTVSRVHAQIVRRQGVVVIVSRSPNGVNVEGTAVDFGDEVPLPDGATIEMGHYAIRAAVLPAPSASKT